MAALGKWWSLHTNHYAWLLGDVLTAARDGRLSSTWRADLIARTMNPPPRRSIFEPLGRVSSPVSNPLFAGTPVDSAPPQPPKPPVAGLVLKSCVLGQRGRGPCADLDADTVQTCAALDVAHIPSAPWEPHAAKGDWRAALDAWFAAASAVAADAALAARVIRLARPDPTSAGVEEYRLDQERIERDLLEVSYRAGIEAGTGVDNGWRDWLAERLDHWGDSQRRKQHHLALLNHDMPHWGHVPSTPRDADVAHDPYRGALGAAPPLPPLPAHPIPDYWRTPDREGSTP